jgi:mono/diheme cytochrome c family protein
MPAWAIIIKIYNRLGFGSMTRLTAVLISLIVGSAWSGAAFAADAAKGEVMAKRWCAACHVVAADQTTGGTQAPPFSSIAKKPGLDAGEIALFLLVPHPRMPDMNLSRAEAADLAVYIKSQ